MTRSSPKLYVALPQEGDFGWGIVSRGFMQEFDKLVPTTPVRVRDGQVRLVDAPAFVCLGSGDLTPVAEVRGTRSYGHAVFETALHEKGVLRAQEYEKILCSSSWCRDRCLEAGIAHADVLLQGIEGLQEGGEFGESAVQASLKEANPKLWGSVHILSSVTSFEPLRPVSINR